MNAANDRLRKAALSEQGMPISAGGMSPDASDAPLSELALESSEARMRFRQAALAENGMPISAGWIAAPISDKESPMRFLAADELVAGDGVPAKR